MSLHVDDVAPEQLTLDCVPDEGVDLSAVTAASLLVRKPDGTETTWAVVMTDQTPTTLTLTHDFSAPPSELDIAGEWRIWAKLTLPTGTIYSDRVVLPVKAKHAL